MADCAHLSILRDICVDKMIKIQDIIFWIIIALIVGLAIWLMLGSPTIEAGLISLALFVASSVILLWKAIFKIDKNVSMGFLKVKNKLEKINYKLEYEIKSIREDISEIKNIVKKSK